MPTCTLAVKVIPNAARSELAGWLDEVLKVKIRAPASEGRANDALCAFLAEKLRLPMRAVALRHGAKSRQKFVQIDGLTRLEARERLAQD